MIKAMIKEIYHDHSICGQLAKADMDLGNIIKSLWISTTMDQTQYI